MNCLLPGVNLKILGKAIQALSKNGDELFVVPEKESLSFRTVNMAKTTYISFDFQLSFFTYYKIDDKVKNLEELHCKVPMRSIRGVFKSPADLEKQVEVCSIELQPHSTKMVFQFRCKHNITKTKCLNLSDSENLKVVFNDRSLNCITGRSSILNNAIANFRLNDEDISLEVSERSLTLKNFIDGEANYRKTIRSQISLSASEFDYFQIKRKVCVTFLLKTFKSAVQFAEGLNMPISLHFETPGQPVVLKLTCPIFDAAFVMQTMNPDSETQSTVTSEASSLVPQHPRESQHDGNESPQEFSQQTKKLITVFDRLINGPEDYKRKFANVVVYAENSDPECSEWDNY